MVSAMQINRHALRAIRESQGVSKADLARAIGVDRTLITRIESGERAASSTQIQSMARALGCSPLALTGALPAPTEVA
jgi:transcriptional regulator with XRE-family HTH domain